jgi:hypothetical protein
MFTFEPFAKPECNHSSFGFCLRNGESQNEGGKVLGRASGGGKHVGRRESGGFAR